MGTRRSRPRVCGHIGNEAEGPRACASETEWLHRKNLAIKPDFYDGPSADAPADNANDEYNPETERFTPGLFCSVFDLSQHGEAPKQEPEITHDVIGDSGPGCGGLCLSEACELERLVRQGLLDFACP